MKKPFIIFLFLCLISSALADPLGGLDGLSLQDLKALRKEADDRIRRLTLPDSDEYVLVGDGERYFRRPQDHIGERVMLEGRLFSVRQSADAEAYFVSLDHHPQRVFLLRYVPQPDALNLLPGDPVSAYGVFRGLHPQDDEDPLARGAGVIDADLIILRSQPEPALAADPYAATWEDPAPPGVKAVYKGSFWSGYASFEINILSMVRGNAALKAAQKMSNYNITPPRNQEWYIVTLWVKALEAPGDRAEIKSEDFHFISRSGTEYRHHFLINDIQGLRTLYTGSEQTAHIACLIDKGDEPLIVYLPNSLNPLWFDPGRQAEEAPAT